MILYFRTLLLRSSLPPLPHYLVEEGFVAVDHLIDDIAVTDGLEVFPCTVDLGLLDQTQLHGVHRTLGLRNEINMFYRALIEGDRPIREVDHNKPAISSIRLI